MVGSFDTVGLFDMIGLFESNNISKGPQTKMLHVYVGSSKPDLIS